MTDDEQAIREWIINTLLDFQNVAFTSQDLEMLEQRVAKRSDIRNHRMFTYTVARNWAISQQRRQESWLCANTETTLCMKPNACATQRVK